MRTVTNVFINKTASIKDHGSRRLVNSIKISRTLEWPRRLWLRRWIANWARLNLGSISMRIRIFYILVAHYALFAAVWVHWVIIRLICIYRFWRSFTLVIAVQYDHIISPYYIKLYACIGSAFSPSRTLKVWQPFIIVGYWTLSPFVVPCFLLATITV